MIAIIQFNCSITPDKNVDEVVSEELILKEFQHQLKRDLEDDNINGSISAAVLKGDKIIWSKAFGFVDNTSKTKADTTTIYRIGSITKTFTSILMMQLLEEGIIELEDPIEKYVPEVKELIGYSDMTKITFLQLASHTSGLHREPNMEDASDGPINEWKNKVLKAIPSISFQSSPGEKYSYSNIGYGILGLALSRAVKKPYIQLVKDNIFIPLGMTTTFFNVPNSKLDQLAVGMEGGPFGEINMEIPKKEHAGRGYKVPNGAIYSTPNDMAKFMGAMMGFQNLVHPSNLAQMHQSPLPEDETWWQNYGLGIRLLRDSIISTAGHTGSVSGYTANFMYQREGEYGVVIMRNYNWGMTNIDLRSFAVLRRLKKITKNN